MPATTLSPEVVTEHALLLRTEVESDEVMEEDEASADAYAEMMRRRAALTRIHRPLGIATYAAMASAVVLGGIQYHNLYGFFAGRDDNPCARGTALFGQGQCSGTPWPHRISGLGTGVLYASTFAVSLLMPDPGDLTEGESEYARNLRMHKLLRWVHFGGMLLQVALGYLVANSERIGLDRANDYGTMQALSTVHMATGLVTFGAMTWGMLIML